MTQRAFPTNGNPELLITVSAPYGTGGSVIAPALSEILGVPFLDRVTTPDTPVEALAPRERLSVHETKTKPVHHLLASLTHAMPAGPTLSPPSAHCQENELRRHAETELFALVESGQGVILGRAAAVVLGKDCGYHVRLEGPPTRRLVQGARIESLNTDVARIHMKATDEVRTSYVRRLYRVDPRNPSLYHLVIDSTAIPLDVVVETILTAARAAKAVAEHT